MFSIQHSHIGVKYSGGVQLPPLLNWGCRTVQAFRPVTENALS